MTSPSPLRPLLARHDLPLLPYALGDGSSPEGEPPLVVAAFGPVAIEYAALRRGAGLFDMPHRATVEVVGADRIEFLQRMLTQDLVGVGVPRPPLACCDSFWCNRKGRIDADARLMLLEDRVLVDVDVHAAERFVSTLDAFLIADDCELRPAGDRWHRLGLHGPASLAVLQASGTLISGDPTAADTASVWRIGTEAGAVECIADHRRITGDLGYELSVPTESAAAVALALFRAGGWAESEDPFEPRAFDEGGVDDARRTLLPVGWHAVNTARLEAGTAMYLLDFGAEHLPHETGLVDDRVAFNKGCYLGQEIVARMQSLGNPKQVLVALDLSREGVPPNDLEQPGEGAAVLAEVDGAREAVGAVTSSSVSPMLGGRPICLAMVRWKHAQHGSELAVTAEGEVLTARVRDTRAYWSPASATDSA